MKEIIDNLFKQFCKETKRSGGVLVGSSISEWNNYLANNLVTPFEMSHYGDPNVTIVIS